MACFYPDTPMRIALPQRSLLHEFSAATIQTDAPSGMESPLQRGAYTRRIAFATIAITSGG
jgi:hypothetical protein